MPEKESIFSQCLSEFVGTYLLVFTVGCNVIDGNPVWAATSIACVLMVMIYALGSVSGANFNPAVSLAIALSGQANIITTVSYMVVQLAAGFLAALSYYGMYGKTFALGPGSGFGWGGACVAEAFYTFMLCFVVLNVACSPNTNGGNQFFGLAIGFVIVAGGYAVGGISGGAFNPAVAFGIDFIDKGFGARWCYAYLGFEFLGAALAAALFRVVRPAEFGLGIPAIASNLCSEFLGTFFLVLTVGFNVLGGSKAAGFSIAASLMCMIYALGNVSGAHFNPAVTTAILLSGREKIDIVSAGAYIIVQLLGGTCAGMVYGFTMGEGFKLSPVAPYGWVSASVAEIVFTFVLCFVVLSVATVAAPSKDMFGLAIGSCITAGGYAIGAVSGGSLNPAVSLGIEVGNGFKGFWAAALIYTGLELVGAALAAGIFRATRPNEYMKGLRLMRGMKKAKNEDEKIAEPQVPHFWIGADDDDDNVTETVYGSI